MRLPSAMLTVIVLIAGLSTTALATQGQPQPAPRGQGGMIGGVQRPDRPPQPGPQGRGPVRDPRQPPAEGTATVRGRVVDGATGAAIPRAKVRMSGRDPRSARSATTDAEGVFTLTKVPAGSLMVTVEKATYLPGLYPDRRRTMRGSNVTIADGQTIDNLNIQLYRGGAITGRVIDAFGDPIENAMVQAIPVAQNNRSLPASRLYGGRSFQGTNDIGEFRISRLEPGQYYLLAMPQRRGSFDEDGGGAPGRTYYPGVASIDQAQPITLERGGSITGIDFQMIETTLTKVTGFVLSAKGTPAKGGHVSARTTNATKGTRGFGMGMPDGGGAGVDQYGAFELMLQPGEYVIEGMAARGEDGQRIQGGNFQMDRGQVKLMVGGEAISGVTIATGQGGVVSGRFVFKGTSPPPTSFQGFNVNFIGADGMTSDDCRIFDRTNVNADGTFTAANLWGTCQVRGGGMAKGWTFEAVMHNGNNISNRVIEFGAGRTVSGVEIVYSDRVGDIVATVSDESGQPTQDYVTIAFPVEKEKWSDSRFLRWQAMSGNNNANAGVGGAVAGRVSATLEMSGAMANPGMMGPGMMIMGGQANSLRQLLAGDYFVVAVEDAASEDLRDPEYLERLSQMATRVSLTPGETQNVQLRRVKAPE